jgi:hypothetical protein
MTRSILALALAFGGPAAAAVVEAPIPGGIEMLPSARLPGAFHGRMISSPGLGISLPAPLPRRIPAAIAAPRAKAPFIKALSRAAARLAAARQAGEQDGREADPAQAAGAFFDGSDAAGAAPAAELLDLRFSREARQPLLGSEILASIRLINGSGSQWYWERFASNVPVRVLVGGKTLFVTRILDARTKAVKDLKREDFSGIYPASLLGERGPDGKLTWPLPKLREKLLADLQGYQRPYKGRSPRVLTLSDQVRVLRFMPYREARHLPENREEPFLEPRLRKAVRVPPSLSSLSRFLPKLVFIDLRLFQDSIPYELLEDMGKLMKAGVYMVFLSEKPQQGPGSVQEMMTRGLTPRQRDDLVTYKLLSLSDGGNTLSEFRGAFASEIPLRRFSPRDIELMEFVARRLGALAPRAGAKEFSIPLAPGADAAAFEAGLKAGLSEYGIPPSRYALSRSGGTLTLRPFSLAGAMGALRDALREREGLFVLPGDVLTVSRDAELLAELKGSIQPAALAPELEGRDLVETSLAAMLGRYRENLPGDLAASASKITAFQKGYGQDGGRHESIYMLMGHIIHSAFNWAVWVYRMTGELPGPDGVVARAMTLWRGEELQRVAHVIEKPGSSMAEYLQIIEDRLRGMHAQLASLLEKYPIVLGTELPNLFVIDRVKHAKGSLLPYRDILRFVFDLVVARRTEQGLEVRIADFKTGQTPTLQNLAKDTQVLLYDSIPRKAWAEVNLPYGASGAAEKVADIGVTFLFQTAPYSPALNDWDRLMFDDFLRKTMNKMRKKLSEQKPE